MNFETAYALFDGNKLSVINYRVQVFWHKSQAEVNCPEGHTIRKVKIEPTVSLSKGGEL